MKLLVHFLNEVKPFHNLSICIQSYQNELMGYDTQGDMSYLIMIQDM
jgi:hypothetical protein